ncbi:amino acid adenylation domain-containing protein [Streptomyces sp. NPDC001852]|uniref:amino acid adenylation domain-containing protein n=1 Tax=Streptomyces sp. NPDC001852 TaxID=3364619 RepID=UPI0036A16209
MKSTKLTETDPWPAYLADVAPVRLTTDRPRHATGRHGIGTVERRLAAVDTTRLHELSLTAGVPAALSVLAAWAAVLHRHTGQRGLLVGVDTAVLAEVVGVADLPTGVAPVGLTVDPAAPFTDLLTHVRTAVTRAAHLVGGAGLPGHTADLAAVFGQRYVRDPGPYDPAPAAETALAVHARDTATDLVLRHHTGLFTESTAAWLLGHVATLLSGVLAAPARPLREVRVQDEPPVAAWGLPVPEGHVPPEPVRPGETLVDRFRRTTAMHPDRPAVIGASGSLTYAGLDRASAAVAARLGRFAGSGQRVALLCEHDIGAVVAVWSVLRTGAAYVPLDPRQPDGRLTRLLADADVTAILCDTRLTGRAQALAHGTRVIPLGRPEDSAGPATEPPRLDPEAPAYLLHTSGSTGAPKAVVQTQGNVLAHALVYAARVRLGPGDRIPLLARYTFDANVMDVYGALLTGAAVHVVDPLLPAPELRRRLAETGCSVLHCTPTLFRHLVGDLPEDATRPEQTLAKIRVVVLGGEEAVPRDLARFRALFPPGSRLVNGLGPTECTVVLQYLADPADLAGTALPVGHPVEGVRIRLLDEDARPTEIMGELEVLSPRVARGYWNSPETTTVAFGGTADAYVSYRTGDLLRRRADGALVFHGRKDRQIKIRGYRVEPGEIEAVLRGHPTVAEAVVVLDGEAPAPRLIGYVTPATGFPPDTEELHGYLTRTLPDHAVPQRIVALDRLPLGPTGKLDRARLPRPETTTAPTDDVPHTPVQRAVARIWGRVLGVSEVALHGNFMAGGGDSIRLLEMVAAIEEEFDVDVPLMEFLAAPTVATMADLIEQETRC